MKINTSTLIGPSLDWAVSALVGIKWEPGDFAAREYGPGFKPSTDWSQGGPIIEREGISSIRQTVEPPRWVSEYSNGCGRSDHARSYGTTPLLAAMRCYVASKLGDTVEVPDELC